MESLTLYAETRETATAAGAPMRFPIGALRPERTRGSQLDPVLGAQPGGVFVSASGQ